jgi:hypothetical protein
MVDYDIRHNSDSDAIELHDEDAVLNDPDLESGDSICKCCRSIAQDVIDHAGSRMYPIRYVVMKRFWTRIHERWPALTQASFITRFQAFMANHPAIAARIPNSGWYRDRVRIASRIHVHRGG